MNIYQDNILGFRIAGRDALFPSTHVSLSALSAAFEISPAWLDEIYTTRRVWFYLLVVHGD
jgi:hypothetical protein